jgi:hypothetical protein
MFRRFCAWTVLALGSAARAAAAQDDATKLLPPGQPIEQVIDHYLDAELKAAGTAAAPAADDATVLRRLSLDLAGRIPTLAETAEYLASSDPDRRLKLVERLLASPGYVRHQAQEFFTLLRAESPSGKSPVGGPLRDYLTVCFAENRPWSRTFRELMLPEEADPKARGAGEFLKGRVRDLNRLAVDVSTVFFGVNISCAQCHDHPHVRDWTQDHFYGMKSFFARTFEAGGFIGESDFGVVKYVPNKGKEKLAPVMFLTGKTIDGAVLKEPGKEEQKKLRGLIEAAKRAKKAPPRPRLSLRAKLVETALAPGQQDFFARSIVNRLWYRFYGRGLVMPLDQMHMANPASHPELLQWLARDLVEHGYDLRRLTRGLVLSRTYARSSRWDGPSPPPDKLFAVAKTRALTPMQLALSLRLAAADPQALPRDPAGLEKRIEALARSAEGLASFFPQPGDNFQVGVVEAMLFANNDRLQKELLDGAGTLAARLKEVPDLNQRADLAVRTALGRPALPEEAKALSAYWQQRPDRPEAACRQVVWALLAGAEFRFNH